MRSTKLPLLLVVRAAILGIAAVGMSVVLSIALLLKGGPEVGLEDAPERPAPAEFRDSWGPPANDAETPHAPRDSASPDGLGVAERRDVLAGAAAPGVGIAAAPV